MDLVEQLIAAQLPSPARRRSIRVSAGVSLRDVAAALGVNPMTVLRWERGDVEPRRNSAIRYRQLLDRIAAATR